MKGQKKIVDKEVGDHNSLYILKEDMITESVGCRGWKKILEIEDFELATLSILDNFSQITKDVINKATRTRSTELQGPLMNMYISLWN